MRSLLLALDDTPGGGGAADCALALARRHAAAIVGVAVLDVDYLTASEPGGVGTAYYKFRTDVARLKQAHERGERLRSAFLQRCAALNVKGEVLVLEGAPSAELRTAAGAHDLIVIGRDSDLHGEPGTGLARTVARLLRENPRPILATPGSFGDLSRVVIAYDGSVAAARCLQVYTLLGLAAGAEIQVVAVAPSQDLAGRWARSASAYLALYDVPSVVRPIAAAAEPAEVVISECRSLGADLLVMGAYGQRGWREALLGSFTTRMLAECPTALFIHH